MAVKGEKNVSKWRSLNNFPPCGEIILKLKPIIDNKEAAFWLGVSVHQIGTVTGEGDIFCRGKIVRHSRIEGWAPLPE